MYTVEPMAVQHGAGVISILNHYAEHSFASYALGPRPESFFERFLEIADGYPAYVALDEMGEVVGFSFIHRFHTSLSFARTAELTHFFHPDHTGKGLGKMLLERLVAEAPQAGVDNIVASISARNPGSIAFHARNGFVECGRFREVGRKFDSDFDVVYMQRLLRDGQAEN